MSESQPPPDVETLFKRYKETGDTAIREQLILMHDKLVRFLARKFADRGEPLNDLVQVGYIGLINAVDRFDPERGTKFSTYATPTIVGEIRRHFRDTRWSLKVPRRLQELNLAVRKLTDQMSHTLGHSPTVEELAQKLQVSEEDVLEAMELGFIAYETVSLDAAVETEGESGGTTLSDFVGSNDQTLDHFDMNYRLKEAIEELEPRERLVVTLKFFESLSQTDIAKRLNCSQMQVSRIQRRALIRLREAMRD
ncbi:MAG: SigB/SigF/SigG family RNA polymerase sigma factor [Chloroflexi bacterium]|nr:SigB/SigF/SigG family RNA polymerase sigma factor [Chloroflexota bacterium]